MYDYKSPGLPIGMGTSNRALIKRSRTVCQADISVQNRRGAVGRCSWIIFMKSLWGSVVEIFSADLGGQAESWVLGGSIHFSSVLQMESNLAREA